MNLGVQPISLPKFKTINTLLFKLKEAKLISKYDLKHIRDKIRIRIKFVQANNEEASQMKWISVNTVKLMQAAENGIPSIEEIKKTIIHTEIQSTLPENDQIMDQTPAPELPPEDDKSQQYEQDFPTLDKRPSKRTLASGSPKKSGKKQLFYSTPQK